MKLLLGLSHLFSNFMDDPKVFSGLVPSIHSLKSQKCFFRRRRPERCQKVEEQESRKNKRGFDRVPSKTCKHIHSSKAFLMVTR